MSGSIVSVEAVSALLGCDLVPQCTNAQIRLGQVSDFEASTDSGLGTYVWPIRGETYPSTVLHKKL